MYVEITYSDRKKCEKDAKDDYRYKKKKKDLKSPLYLKITIQMIFTQNKNKNHKFRAHYLKKK